MEINKLPFHEYFLEGYEQGDTAEVVVCQACYSVVLSAYFEEHIEWHGRLNG